MSMNSAAARDAGALLTTGSGLAARVGRDLFELRRILDRADSEEEADFVGEIAAEFEEFVQHLEGLNEKRAEPQSRALKSLTAALESPGLSE